MKKMIILLALPLLFSCSSYQQASNASRQAYLGMSVAEFQKTSGKKATMEAMEEGFQVYRMNDFDAWTGYRKDTRFFYFTDGKLYKIDGGQFRQNRYQVEVTGN